MNRKELFDYYEKHYFFEAEQRDTLTNRCQIPLAILAAILSGYSLIIKSIFQPNIFPSNYYYYSYVALFIVSLICFLKAVADAKKALYGNNYKLIADALECDNYYKECVKLYKDKNYFDEDELVRSAVNDFMVDSYVECAAHNSKVNDNRSEWLFSANKFTFLCVVPLAFGIGLHFYLIAGQDETKKVTKVQLVGELGETLNKDKAFDINGKFESSVLYLDFSSEVKDYLNEQKEGKKRGTAAAKATD